MIDTKTTHSQPDDRRWACPGLFRMPMSGDGGICRIKLELGKINATQLRILAQLVSEYGDGQLEVTTRANVQIRGVAAHHSHVLSQKLIMAGFGPRVKNGDDVRNIMVNPTAGIDKFALGDIRPFAEDLSLHVQQHYQKLSPKFSFLIDGGEACAVLDHQSDIWLSLCDHGNNFAFGLASCPTTESLPIKALGKVPYNQGHQLIYALLDLLLTMQKSASDIQRMKHLVGILNNDDIITALKLNSIHIQSADDFCRQPMTRHYLGIHQTNRDNRFYVGIKPPFARLTPDMLESLADSLIESTDCNEMRFTPWQSILFPDCSYKDAQDIAAILGEKDFIISADDVRGKILCCAGAPKCSKAKSNTLNDAKTLAASLENIEIDNIHLTGCPKSCAATKALSTTLVAKEQGIYDIYGKAEISTLEKFDETQLAENKFGTLIAKNLDLSQVAALLMKRKLTRA